MKKTSIRKLISILAVLGLMCSIHAVPVSADNDWLWGVDEDRITGERYSPLRKRLWYYSMQPDSYDILDSGFGAVEVNVWRIGISVSMKEALTESMQLGEFTLAPEFPKGTRSPYICRVIPQTELLAYYSSYSFADTKMYISADSDLTHCRMIGTDSSAETLPDENNYVIEQSTYGQDKMDDTGAFLELLRALYDDPRFTVNGAVYSCDQTDLMYMNELYAEFADMDAKAEFEAALTALGQTADARIRKDDDGTEYYYYSCSAANAKQMLIRFADDPRIARLLPTIIVDHCEETWEDVSLTHLLLPAHRPGTGDLNGDGETNIGDAVLLSRFNAEDSELDASTLNMDEADLNADGVTDALDLAELLRQLANTTA